MSSKYFQKGEYHGESSVFLYFRCHQTGFLGTCLNWVPTQILFTNSLCFPCIFTVQLEIYSVPISEYEKFTANIAIFCIFRIRKLTPCANKILCVLAKFPNSLFSLIGNFWAIFPIFPVEWPYLMVYVFSIQAMYLVQDLTSLRRCIEVLRWWRRTSFQDGDLNIFWRMLAIELAHSRPDLVGKKSIH